MTTSVKEKVIVFDCDDTLVSFVDYLLEFYNAIHDTDIKSSSILCWNFSNDFVTNKGIVKGIDVIKFYEQYEKNGFHATQPLLPQAKNALEFVKELGFKVLIITARPESARKQTEINFFLNNISCDEIYFTENKAELINELSAKYDIEMFIDDNSGHIDKVSKICNVKYNCLIDMAHNRDLELGENTYRVNNAYEAVTMLDR